MTENEALLQAVCAEPDNDEPRLVYADWLEENGDLARAEFIRMQLKLAKTPYRSYPWDRLTIQRRIMDKWLEQLPALQGILWYPLFRRGFPAAVEVENFAAFRSHAATLFRTAPIEYVRFRRLRGTKRLAAMPDLARLTELDLGNLRLGPGDAEILANSPYLAGLRELHLNNNRLGDQGVIALTRSPHLKKLVKIDLSNNNIGAEGVKVLARAPILESVRHLDLVGNDIDDEGAEALVHSPYLQDIDGLTFAAWNFHGISEESYRRLKERYGFHVVFGD